MRPFVRLGRPTGPRGHRREKNFSTRIAQGFPRHLDPLNAGHLFARGTDGFPRGPPNPPHHRYQLSPDQGFDNGGIVAETMGEIPVVLSCRKIQFPRSQQ